uniref:NADP-dependent oxidoreductase domain-containing protein n=1 Tax=Arion vulgaris TaxID=1028688 RepID=A0A0B6ZIA9_9EUPU
MSVMPETYVEGFHDVSQVKLMPYRSLGKTGLSVSALSFGASSLGSVFRSTDESESLEVVKIALQSGINYVDTAPWYGHGKSESVLGKILPTIPRASYYIATKVGRYQADVNNMFDFSAERTLQSVDESLQRLGLEYVDGIQIHDMEFAPSLDIILSETLPALQKVKDAGKAKFIGITGYPLANFNIVAALFRTCFCAEKCEQNVLAGVQVDLFFWSRTVLEKSHVHIDTILTYCRASMNDNSLRDWLPYFHNHGVGVVNASPISMGLLSNRGPPSWNPASLIIKKACAEAASYCNDNGVDISRLGLKFTIDQEDIPTTLVSTASCDNVRRNIDSVYTPLSDKEQQVLEEVMERYMKPLNNANWEGVEVANYWRLLAEQQGKTTLVECQEKSELS